MNTFADRLKKELDRKGRGAISQLARACHVSPQSARRWLMGVQPRPEQFKAAAEFCGVSEAYLRYGDAPARDRLPEPMLEFLVGDEIRLIQNFRRATEDGKRQLLISSDVVEKIPANQLNTLTRSAGN